MARLKTGWLGPVCRPEPGGRYEVRNNYGDVFAVYGFFGTTPGLNKSDRSLTPGEAASPR